MCGFWISAPNGSFATMKAIDEAFWVQVVVDKAVLVFGLKQSMAVELNSRNWVLAAVNLPCADEGDIMSRWQEHQPQILAVSHLIMALGGPTRKIMPMNRHWLFVVLENAEYLHGDTGRLNLLLRANPKPRHSMHS